MILPTAEDVGRVIEYNPTTGILVWISGPRAGKAAGHKGKKGYIIIDLRDRNYRAHRIAWLLSFGVWPEETIDHINGNPSDNRLCNLREATKHQNLLNRGGRNSSAGLKGVSITRSGRYRAKITMDGKEHWLGVFGTAEVAHQVYVEAAKKLHGEFARFA